MDPPITLALPAEQPDPMPGCGVCAALAQQRAEAMGRRDWSRVTDCNVEIRNHHHAPKANA
ncbi:hypothetical protein [Streptomyces sp. PR69]|uniref:hypothetical protein n=1 Tax=Streptomyces sp. PR69 TaxID=2984950 RepID=UPI002265066E|nr:hypothetical protein [Streptomyces sp. PR69]